METEYTVWLLRHCQTKGAAPDMLDLNTTAPRLYSTHTHGILEARDGRQGVGPVANVLQLHAGRRWPHPRRSEPPETVTAVEIGGVCIVPAEESCVDPVVEQSVLSPGCLIAHATYATGPVSMDRTVPEFGRECHAEGSLAP